MTSGGTHSGAASREQQPLGRSEPDPRPTALSDDRGPEEGETSTGVREMAKPVHSTGSAHDVHHDDILSLEHKPAVPPVTNTQIPPASVKPSTSLESLQDDLPELGDYYQQQQEASTDKQVEPNPVPVSAAPAMFSAGPSRPRVINMRAQSSSDEDRKEKEYKLSRLEGGMGHLPGALHDDIRVVTERRTRGGSKTPQSSEKTKSSRGKNSRSRGHHKPLPSNPAVTMEGAAPTHDDNIDDDDGDDIGVGKVESPVPVVSAVAQIPSSLPVIPAEPISLAHAPATAAVPGPTSTPLPISTDERQVTGVSAGTERPSEISVQPLGESTPAIPQGQIVDLRKRAKELKRQARMEMKKRAKGKNRGRHKPLPSPVETDAAPPSCPDSPVSVASDASPGADVNSNVSKKSSEKSKRRDGKALPSLPPASEEASDAPSPKTPRPSTPQEQGGPVSIPELPPPAFPPSTDIDTAEVPAAPSPQSSRKKKKPLPPPPIQSESDDNRPRSPPIVTHVATPHATRKRLPTPPTSSSEGEM
eukprot:TRINITY_DN391_c1_g1_i1.p1 TRINITY_DN391_c1_g1~~TRINITY_DN391_c1_g1_i1.p1  ORF type:complete len:597 (+),score=103.56 TRINITY_DN391_c1_g1_i1:201-1793(+)